MKADCVFRKANLDAKVPRWDAWHVLLLVVQVLVELGWVGCLREFCLFVVDGARLRESSGWEVNRLWTLTLLMLTCLSLLS